MTEFTLSVTACWHQTGGISLNLLLNSYICFTEQYCLRKYGTLKADDGDTYIAVRNIPVVCYLQIKRMTVEFRIHFILQLVIKEILCYVSSLGFCMVKYYDDPQVKYSALRKSCNILLKTQTKKE